MAERIVAETVPICYHPRDDFGMKKGLILRMMPVFSDMFTAKGCACSPFSREARKEEKGWLLPKLSNTPFSFGSNANQANLVYNG